MSTLDGQTIQPKTSLVTILTDMQRERQKEMAAQMEKAQLTVGGIVKLAIEVNR
jgi:hypothetical protein